MSRQLKRERKHEIWFLFAGKPVRFSLCEFAIVTGLPCGKYPQKSKKQTRKNITEKPYWPSLFGKLESVTVDLVIRMLKKKTVSDKETRIKFACLALLHSVLLTTTHESKISKEHAEIIKDLDDFFAYPWGRLGFDMVMSSIKERDEISLSQKTLSIPGFALSLQLVMMAAIPALATVVQERCVSPSESGSEDEEEDESADRGVTISLNPGHARELCGDEKTLVHSIIPNEGGVDFENASLTWSEDEDDPKVNNLIKLVNDDHTFSNFMFIGCATRIDVGRMREETNSKKAAERKGAHRGKRKVAIPSQSEFDVDQVSTLCAEKTKADLIRIEENVNISISNLTELRSAFLEFQSNVKKEFTESLELTKTSIISSIKELLDRSRGTRTESFMGSPSRCHDTLVEPNILYSCGTTSFPTEALPTANEGIDKDGVHLPESLLTPTKQNCDPVLVSSTPSFSLGLTQDERHDEDRIMKDRDKSRNMDKESMNQRTPGTYWR